MGRRLELVGERGGVTVYDDYGHNPTELEVTLRTARSLTSGRRDRRLPAARRRAHAPAAPASSGEALGLADAAIVTDIIGARDAPREGVSGKLVVDSLPPEVRAGWAPSPDDAATLALAWARPGDLVITFGVGEPWKIARAIVDGLPAMSAPVFEEGVELARLTTIGTGGPARAYRRAAIACRARGTSCVAARERELQVATVGLGSNLLAADDGVDMLVLRLAGELAEARTEGTMLVAGGGATNAVCLHRARAAALGGFEFACAIPGTAGGGVWMNAGAYGSDWSAILDPRARRDRRRNGLAHAGRARASRTGTRASATARSSRRSSTGSSRATRARSAPTVRDLVDRRKATQPTTKRTFGSVFKNPPGELGAGAMLELCGLKGHRIGGALISPKHANFIENAGGATTADCLALMAEARRRAREQFGVELEHEVVLLGDDRGRLAPDVRLSDPGRSRRGGERSRVASGGRVERGSRPRARDGEASSSRCRGGSPASASIWPGSSPPAARSGSPS